MEPQILDTSSCRCVLLTGNKRRHKYLARVLADSLDLAGIVSEAKSPLSAPMTGRFLSEAA